MACCTSCFDTNYEIPPQSRKFEPGYRSDKRRRAFFIFVFKLFNLKNKTLLRLGLFKKRAAGNKNAKRPPGLDPERALLFSIDHRSRFQQSCFEYALKVVSIGVA
jgi:hypothetical protein